MYVVWKIWELLVVMLTMKAYFSKLFSNLRKLVEIGQMSYAWVYLYRSYIVIDPPTCGACYLESFASQISVLIGILLVHPNPLNQVSSMSVHHIYLYAVFTCRSK